MNVGDVMTAIADALDGVGGLRAFDFPPSTVSPPAAIVGWPEQVDFHSTFGGAVEAVFPVHVLVALVNDRAAAAALAPFVASTGTSSVRAALEGADIGDDCRVTGFAVSVMTVGGSDLLAASFDVRVISS